MILYQYPSQTKVNRVIPKNTFYQKGQANTKMEQLFIQEIESIIWAYKLSSATIHINSSEQTKEIQIFHIHSRVPTLNEEILTFIDKTIPSPIIFEIYYQDTITLSAAYKRPNLNDASLTVLHQYHHQVFKHTTARQPLPIFLSIQDLYEHLIGQTLPSSNNKKEKEDTSVPIEQKLEQLKKKEILQKQLQQLENQLRREKQFNRKVEINLKIQALKREIITLGG